MELFKWLEKQHHETVYCSKELTVQWCREQNFDLAISYTYRYILSRDILSALNDNVVNIHNSYLPWNRGADPNLWSIVDGTPRGVSLHYMNAELDKGYIIAQKLVEKKPGETLQSSYKELDKAAKELFREAFSFYRDWPQMKKVPLGTGTYHSVKKGERIRSVIDTYDITIAEFREKLKQVL